MSVTPLPRCTFDVDRDGNPCGRTMITPPGAAPYCPVHDRIRCTATVTRDGRPAECGHRLVGDDEEVCPSCRKSVRLYDVLRRGQA